MNTKRYAIYVVVGVLLIVSIYMITAYNSLVKKEEQVKLQWNEVQNAYQRRLDFIPNVVNIVKGKANYEQTTLQKVIEARMGASSVNISATIPTANEYNLQTKAHNELAIASNQLIINVENYPELKGAKAFSALQTQLEGTERRIKFARKDFNAAIAAYNSYVKSFPARWIARIFGFTYKEGFQSDEGTNKSIEIKFE